MGLINNYLASQQQSYCSSDDIATTNGMKELGVGLHRPSVTTNQNLITINRWAPTPPFQKELLHDHSHNILTSETD